MICTRFLCQSLGWVQDSYLFSESVGRHFFSGVRSVGVWKRARHSSSTGMMTGAELQEAVCTENFSFRLVPILRVSHGKICVIRTQKMLFKANISIRIICAALATYSHNRLLNKEI